ncbi:ESCRT-II complex subunit [Podospora australis]|uniref:Vacuolar protein-sorting-associated protein 25 n=1 Tax=Podospora australis TaxID=1536484 RepID=A0AAN6WZX4_9PEZI|nr:ESCRT-II complex subunit [Podospora australis]
MTTPSDPFVFPREYYFPPFFTRQTNLTTHHAQLTKWSSLILSYCRHHRLFKISLSDFAEKDLFFNKQLNRRLSLSDIREVIDFMRKNDNRAEYADSDQKNGGAGKDGAGGGGGDIVWIYWRTPEEWASLVESWVEGTAQKGTVLTVYELTEGEGTRGTEFWGIDQELLLKALQILVKRGKAQIFGQEDSLGVKFF